MKRKIFIGFTILMMVIIFAFSNQPKEKSSKVSEKVATTVGIEPVNQYTTASAKPLFAGLSIRKYAHILLYFLLGVGAYGACEIDKKRIQIMSAFLLCYIYSISDEVHQLFIEGREGQLKDCGVDALGYGAAILICFLINLLTISIKKVTQE